MKGWARRREEGRRRGLHFLACAPNESPHYKQKMARQIIHGLRFLRRSTISVVRTSMEGRDGTILSPPLKAASHCLRHGSPRSLRDGLVSWRKTQMFCRKEKVPFNCFHRKRRLSELEGPIKRVCGTIEANFLPQLERCVPLFEVNGNTPVRQSTSVSVWQEAGGSLRWGSLQLFTFLLFFCVEYIVAMQCIYPDLYFDLHLLDAKVKRICNSPK